MSTHEVDSLSDGRCAPVSRHGVTSASRAPMAGNASFVLTVDIESIVTVTQAGMDMLSLKIEKGCALWPKTVFRLTVL